MGRDSLTKAGRQDGQADMTGQPAGRQAGAEQTYFVQALVGQRLAVGPAPRQTTAEWRGWVRAAASRSITEANSHQAQLRQPALPQHPLQRDQRCAPPLLSGGSLREQQVVARLQRRPPLVHEGLQLGVDVGAQREGRPLAVGAPGL